MEQDRSQSLARVTVDSSLIYPTTTRRFIMALWEMEDLRVDLVPRAVREMWGFVQDSEHDYWSRRLKKEAVRTGTRLPADTATAIEKAAAVAAGAWVNVELGYAGIPGRNDSMLNAVTMTQEQERLANEITGEIPMECFAGHSKNNHRGDREIISQSVATGFRILASDNRSSILRPQINGWLTEQNLVPGEFVLNGDEAIDHAGTWKEQPARMLEAVLRATLPTLPGSARRENEIVETFIARMRDEGLPSTAKSCAAQWEGEHQAEIYERARAYVAGPGTLARNTEDRRVKAARDAARRAGYVER